MPPGKAIQSNAMLYTVITFVGLFIIAATCAVIFYIKAEDYRTQRDNSMDMTNKLVNRSEQNNLSKIVGKAEKGKSILGTVLGYLDEMIKNTTGQVPEDTTAAEKFNHANLKINESLQSLGPDVAAGYGPESVDLVHSIERLKSILDQTVKTAQSLHEMYQKLNDEFDAASRSYAATIKKLEDEKNQYREEVHAKIISDYEKHGQFMTEQTQDLIAGYQDKLDGIKADLKQKNLEIVKLRSDLENTNESLQLALSKLEDIKPRPDIKVAAYIPDARIVRIDTQANVVYLDIGSDDHVYQGLTFAVYSSNAPIPEDGKGKAEIEVFRVTKDIAVAKINSSSKKNPIVIDDIVANLIWDSEISNKFIVAGEFDFDQDGIVESDGAEKIRRLIERWGGKIVDDVSIETDFIVLGNKARIVPEPTSEEIDADPIAEQRYQNSIRNSARYDSIQTAAEILHVPIFNQNRFIHLIGYKSTAERSTPF